MYLVVAKMRLLISESISNSDPVAVEHSAMEPVHSVSNGMKSPAKPTDWEWAAENRQRTVRIAMIESPLSLLSLSRFFEPSLSLFLYFAFISLGADLEKSGLLLHLNNGDWRTREPSSSNQT